MKLFRFIVGFCAGIVVTGMGIMAVSSALAGSENRTPPNVIFILVDDMGYGDLSLTGNPLIETPNIDALAAEGILYTQFYVSSPVCSPSRAGLVTGQYPQKHRIHSFLHTREANAARLQADYLDADAPTIPKLLKQAGYRTAHFGKWHLGGGRDVDDAPLPTAYGFDESYVSFEGLGPRVLISDHNNTLSQQNADPARGPVDWAPKGKLTKIYVDRGIEFIHREDDRPFYLELWLNDVHSIHLPTEESMARVEDIDVSETWKKYLAVVKEVDVQLGRLFDALEASGQADNTLIIFTSDHGPEGGARYYEGGNTAPGFSGDRRGRKLSLYEGGIRVPLIVKWPAGAAAGKTDDKTIISAMDLLPTLEDVTETDDLRPSDGVSIMQTFSGPPMTQERTLFWEYGSFGQARYYARPGLEEDRSPSLAARQGNWKLLVEPDGNGAELFDLSSDPQETNNLCQEQEERCAQMTGEVIAWHQSLPAYQSEMDEENEEGNEE